MTATPTTRLALIGLNLVLSLSSGLACERGRGSASVAPDASASAGICEDFELDVERIWSSSKRREISEGLREFAGETQRMNVERIVTKLDAITSDWVMMSKRACKDTLVRRTMPEEIYVRVSLCLNTALVQQRTLVTQLEAVDRTSYEHIDRAMLDIAENIGACQNQAVLAYYRAPEDTADAEAAQTADDKTAEAQVMLALGNSEAASGLLSSAETAAKKSGDERRELDAAVAACNLAVLESDYERALSHGGPALIQAQRLSYGIGESDVLTCLGTAELRRGNHDGARKRLEAALRLREGFYGPDHPRVADAANRLGNLETAVANYQGAQRLYERALEIWTKTFGPDDPVTSRAYHNLGLVHLGLDDVAGAVRWYTEALRAETNSLGADHPATALTEANFASVLIREGELDRAAALLTHAAEVQARTLGPDHPELAVSYQATGELWAARQDQAKALEWYAKALDLRARAFGEQHLETAKTEDAMATAEFKLGRYADAATLAEQALATREALLGPDNILTATSYFNLGLIAEKRHKFVDALGYYERSLAVEDRVRGPGHALTKDTRAAVDRLRDLIR